MMPTPTSTGALRGAPRGVKVPDTEGQRDWVDMFREATKTGGIKAGQAKA